MLSTLDYTRTGRWQTVAATAGTAAAGAATEIAATEIAATEIAAAVPQICADSAAPLASFRSSLIDAPGSAIRRLLEFTRTGRWLALSVPARAPVPVEPVRKMPLSAEEQALVDAAFFGLDVE
jgi:hypothetical protein